MKKILIIEDDQIVSSVYRNKFIAEGFQAEIAGDGQSGLKMASSFRPDLILLDLMLPDLSGVDVMKQLRARPEFLNLPIIVFSNTYLNSVLQEAWQAGAAKCFSKVNSTPKQILEAVHALLDSPAASAPAAAAQIARGPAAKTGAADDPAREFASQFPAILTALRTQNQAFIKNCDMPSRLQQLEGMSAKMSLLTGSAALAGLNSLARVTDALEALLHDLHAEPQNINPSTLRTIAGSIDFLDVLFKRGGQFDAKPLAFKILVVDDELLSRRAVTHALEKARLKSTDVEDPLAALKLLNENVYDLVILDAEMPGMNGFELCAKLRSLPLHRKTPVVFVTILNEFEARANSTMAGANDFIAKPFLFVELALKALVFVFRARIEAGKTSA